MFQKRMGDATPTVGEKSSLAFGKTSEVSASPSLVRANKRLQAPLPPIKEDECSHTFSSDGESDREPVFPNGPLDREWVNVVKGHLLQSNLIAPDEDVDEKLIELIGDLSFGDNFLLREKEVRGEQYYRKKASKRIRGRRRRMRKKTSPHGLSDDYLDFHDGPCETCGERSCTQHVSQNVYEHEPAEIDLQREEALLKERNEYVHKYVGTPPQTKPETPDDDLKTLLNAVKLPEGLKDVDQETTDWVSLIENLAIFGYQITHAQSMTEIFVASVAYMKMHTTKSLLHEMLSVIDTITKDMPPSEVEPQTWTSRDIKDRWTLIRNNPIFTKISYLITAAMSLTVCSIKKIEWNPFGLKLICLEAAEKQHDAADVIDAMIHTFVWIAETGYRVIEEKSLVPLLYSDQKIRVFNKDCDYVLAHADQVLAGNAGNISDFEQKVDNVIRDVTQLKAAKDTGTTAIWLQQRYERLVDIKFKIVSRHRNTALRFAPFGVGLTGASGVGKSTLAKLVMKIALFAMGFEPDPKRIITKDMFDRFDTLDQSDVQGVFIDDLGQGKSQFAKSPVSDVIIKIFNNVAAQAVKAELNQKGMVFLNYKCGVITSNLLDYDSRSYSNKPEAILRRFVHTRVRIKPEFRIPGGVSLNTKHPQVAGTTSLCQDVWELDLEECFIFENKSGHESYKFRTMRVEVPTIEDPSKTEVIVCKDIGLKEYMRVIISLAMAHSRHQVNLLKRAKAFDDLEMCKSCYHPTEVCICKERMKQTEPHSLTLFEEVVKTSVTTAVSKYVGNWFRPMIWFHRYVGYKPIRYMGTYCLSQEFEHALNKYATPFLIRATPDWLFNTLLFQRAILLWQHSTVMCDLKRPFYTGMIVWGCLGWYQFWHCSFTKFLMTCFATWLYTLLFWSHYRARMRVLKEEYLARRDALPAYSESLGKGKLKKGVFAVTSVVVILKMLHMWNANRKKLESTNPDGLTKDEIENSVGWFGHMMRRIGVTTEGSSASKAATSEQVISTFRKSNVYWAKFIPEGATVTSECNIFFPRKSVAWFPHHMFFENKDFAGEPFARVEVEVDRGNGPGSKFKFKIAYEQCVFLEHLDLVCCYVPNCPDLRDKTKWLPLSKPRGSSICSMVVRRRETFNVDKVSVTHGMTGHKHKAFYGGEYVTTYAKNGSCMAPLVLEQKDPVIVGFHMGGSPGDRGVMMTVLKEDSDKLISLLEQKPGVILSAQAGDIPKTQYGRTVLESTEVHPHSMTSRLKDNDFVDVLGSTKLRTMQRSNVRPSLLSQHIEDVCGVRNKWGPPKLVPNWKGYNATLEHIVNPADMFWPDDLERARQDWLKPLFVAMKEYVKTEDFRPLTEVEMVLGVEGKRFLDPLKMSTGAGFPLFGPKHRLFDEVFDEKGRLIARNPVPELREEMDRCLQCWKRGERAYPVTTATLKDEPTEVNSEKVRVFQAVAVAFGLWIRKYYLPIARFLSLHPLLSESAVGVNAFSEEWQCLMEHVTKYADDDLVIAWDYSKYDVRMNSQITRCVLTCFVDLAEAGGYSKDDLYIMKMMIVDLAHPLIDYNGSLIMAYNMNTSGNNITVNINSVGGALYARLGFFNEYPDEADFRSCVAAMTYGDDFKGSVKKEFRNFNFFSYQKFLARFGMKITPPDKDSEGTAFMLDACADFLKRNSQYIPEIMCWIGRLNEDSIWKSLHANLESKSTTRSMVAVSCIECAMHEWFAFGREHYEMRAEQMREVCRRADLPVPAVSVTYDERVAHWKSKYAC